MTIYEENLKALSADYPQMDRLIEEAKENLEPELEIIEETSYDGETIIKVQKEDRICYLNGKRNTKEPAEKWIESLGTLETNAPVFLMGLGNPSYLKELVEQTEKRLMIIVYEPSFQIFQYFLEHIPIQRWMEKHLIVFWVKGLKGMEDAVMKNLIGRILRFETIPFSRRLISPNYDILFPEEALTFIKMMRDVTNNELTQYNTQMLFSTVAVQNLLDNIKYLCDGYKTVQLTQVIPDDIPGIVVAAGPSLNKNIKELKKAKGKAFIIAVDTAIKPLLAEGIIPDMFAMVDGRKPVMLVKKEGAKEIPLVATITSSSEVMNYHTGMKFFYNEGSVIMDRILMKQDFHYGAVDTGGSVATSAFSLLYKIGLPCVILVGQDLAYTGNKSHADGTFNDVMKEEDTKNYIMVEGNIEKEVPTIANLKMYLDWYGNYIESAQKADKNFRVINATEGGAKIRNTEVMTLHDAIEQECKREVNIQECLQKLSPMLNEESRKWAVEYINSFPDKFLALEKEAKRAKRLYQKLATICNKKNIDVKEYKSVLKKIEKSVKKVEGNDMYQLVNDTMVNARYILLREQFHYENTVQKEGKELARKGILYMENAAKMAALFGEYTREYTCIKETPTEEENINLEETTC